MEKLVPTQTKERFIILDTLRGFALLGICIANFPEFSLYTFLSSEATNAMPMASFDTIMRYLTYTFVDGKFYTIFSILFGIGFSIIIEHAAQRGSSGMLIFYKRMAILLIIGLSHLMLLWSGDILTLYALLGMLMPLFRKLSNKTLIIIATTLLLLPIAIDAIVEHFQLQPAAYFHKMQWHYCALFGITNDNFAYWLQEQNTYKGVLQFLLQGAFERMTEFIDGNRYFKVLGLFFIGLLIGRNRLYAQLPQIKTQLKQLTLICLSIGMPFSILYAYSCMNQHLWGLTIHTLLYTISVFPMGLAYIGIISLYSTTKSNSKILTTLAAPGRMALTNYIGQTIAGICIFYGIGLGLGAHTNLTTTIIIAIIIFATETIISYLWLRKFKYGPFEWLWRMLTYGKYLRLKE